MSHPETTPFDLGSSLGQERFVERARTSEAQLTWVSKGEGSFTAGVLEQLGTNCPSASNKAESLARLWDEYIDDPDREPLGVMLATDIGFGSDQVIRALARCTGDCANCPFDRDTLTMSDAMEIDLSNQHKTKEP